MMTSLRSWRTMGTWSLVLYLATVGAFAGLAAWTMAFAGHLLFDIGRPSGIALVLAIPRGAVFGVVLALILRVYWNRPHRNGGFDERP
jgi:membrane associated rhomboid family serine protease